MAPVSSTAIKPSNIHKLKAVSTAGFVRKMYDYSVLLTNLSLVRSSEALQMNRNKITLLNVLITGIPFNDSREFKTWNFVEIQTTERKHFLPSRLIHKHNN